jgi:hypothetical protein
LKQLKNKYLASGDANEDCDVADTSTILYSAAARRLFPAFASVNTVAYLFS